MTDGAEGSTTAQLYGTKQWGFAAGYRYSQWFNIGMPLSLLNPTHILKAVLTVMVSVRRQWP